jgi:3-isopropylmalate/(R)-2-methylmalate dehydratase small subunit
MGRAFVFGDAVDTDVLAPGHLMKLAPDELATHCLEALAPDFARTVRPGDVVVAGHSFGVGSSREQAAVSLKKLGVSVLAVSFARIFYRNAINVGLPVVQFAQAAEIAPGDELRLDLSLGVVADLTTGKTYSVPALPPHILAMVRDGGLIPHLKIKLAAKRESQP